MRVRKTLAAEQDLLAIWDHIASDNSTAADRLWSRFNDRFKLLVSQPEMGQSQERCRPGLRSITEGSYVIFYEPTKDGITIVRILHGARQWEELL